MLVAPENRSALFLLFPGEEHQNIAALQMSCLLNDTVLLNGNSNFLQYGKPVFLMKHFPSPEHNRNFYFMSLLQELQNMPDFDLEVMLAGIWPQFYFLDMHGALDAFFVKFFALLVFKFAIVHETAYRRVCIR